MFPIRCDRSILVRPFTRCIFSLNVIVIDCICSSRWNDFIFINLDCICSLRWIGFIVIVVYSLKYLLVTHTLTLALLLLLLHPCSRCSRYQLYLDHLPIWGMVGETGILTSSPEENIPDYQDVFLYTHKALTITYNDNRIIHVVLRPEQPVKFSAGTRFDSPRVVVVSICSLLRLTVYMLVASSYCIRSLHRLTLYSRCVQFCRYDT